MQAGQTSCRLLAQSEWTCCLFDRYSRLGKLEVVGTELEHLFGVHHIIHLLNDFAGSATISSAESSVPSSVSVSEMSQNGGAV